MRYRAELSHRAFLASVLFLWALSSAAQSPVASTPPSPQAAQAATKTGCKIVRTAASEGEIDIARKDYKAADSWFTAAIAKGPADTDVHLGLVRALIGENRVDDARNEAIAMQAHDSTSALAEVALADVYFRAADTIAASAHAKAALKLDPCEGRAATAYANLLDLNGYFAGSARLLDAAHRIRPQDELILRDWIDSLPRKERQAQLDKYLNGVNALSTTDKHDAEISLFHLKARRPGECRITSVAENARTPLEFVYGDNNHPVAFGLSVALNGKKRRMQIDTGASGITITKAAAHGLGLEPEYHINTSGVGDEGDAASYLTHVKSIRIGDVEVSDCMVDVIEKSKLDVDGLIGMDVFRRWVVTLDYQSAELRLSPLPPRPGAPEGKPALDTADVSDGNADPEDVPHDRFIAPEMKNWLPIYRIGHEILLASFIGTGPVHYMMMDTGASLSALSPTMAKEAGKLHNSPMEITGISGKVKKVFEVDNVPLVVANLRIPPSTYPSWDMTSTSHEGGFEISGFLGLPTLQRLTIQIDYRDNLVKLTYDPKRDLQRF